MEIINPVRRGVYDWRTEVKELGVAERSNNRKRKSRERSETCHLHVGDQEDMQKCRGRENHHFKSLARCARAREL